MPSSGCLFGPLRSCLRYLPAKTAVLALLAETVAAVNRSVAARLERDLGVLSALGACYRMHFTRSAAAVATTTPTAATVTPGCLFCSATRGAPLGLICEAQLVVTFLFAGRKYETAVTLNAGQVFVCEFHMYPILGKTIKMLPRTIRGNHVSSNWNRSRL